MLILGATSDAPWWGVAVIAGAFGISGAVLGFLGSWLNERRRDQRRNETDLRSAVVDLLAYCDWLYLSAHDIAPPSPAEVVQELLRRYTLVDTLAPNPMAGVARSFLMSIYPGRFLGKDDAEKATYFERREELLKQLRKVLDIKR